MLCAYLGQLSKLRHALANEVVVVIDERDRAQLLHQEEDIEGHYDDSGAVIERVKVAKRVREILETIIAFLTLAHYLVGTTSHRRQLPRRRSESMLSNYR